MNRAPGRRRRQAGSRRRGLGRRVPAAIASARHCMHCESGIRACKRGMGARKSWCQFHGPRGVPGGATSPPACNPRARFSLPTCAWRARSSSCSQLRVAASKARASQPVQAPAGVIAGREERPCAHPAPTAPQAAADGARGWSAAADDDDCAAGAGGLVTSPTSHPTCHADDRHRQHDGQATVHRGSALPGTVRSSGSPGCADRQV